MQDLIVILYYFIPVWAFFIWHIKINSKQAFVLMEFFMLALTVQLAFNPYRIQKITMWLHYYTLFIMVYIMTLGWLTKFRNFNKVLASSLWMVFIAGDFWEIPHFTYDILFLNIANYSIWISSHIHRVYVLATALMFTMQAKIKATRATLTLLALTLGTNFILLWPPFGYKIVARLVTLTAFAFVVYYGVKNGSPLVES